MKRLCLTLLVCLLNSVAMFGAEPPPNIVYIMADELGYFEPGFMGGENIQTPNLDRLAAEGMRLTNMFAGSCVCAPTRCCLMTGKHSGHTSVRVNGGGTPLRADEPTIASVLKARGYAAGGFGKWGCGGRDSTGVPEKHGFDVFFGYYDQVHAHSYYPPYLIRNSEEVPLAGNRGGTSGQTYSQYVIHDAAMKFIRQHSQQSFFAYLPFTPPHGNFNIPDTDPAWARYKDKPWPEEARRYAAMVTMLDRQVGEVLGLLKELGIEQKTLVFFSGDNGGNDYFTSPEHPRGVHSANKHPKTGVEYRGKKGTLYEGGLRVPFVARWPGKIAPGSVSEHLGYFPDVLPTIAEVTGAKAPADVDGVSILPTLIGQSAAGHPQQQHEFLYWEFRDAVAIRQANWRAVRPKPNAPWELYDLSVDPSESNDVAQSKPAVVNKLAALAASAHQPAVEGTFSRSDRHERDRRAKTGHHDQPVTSNEEAVDVWLFGGQSNMQGIAKVADLPSDITKRIDQTWFFSGDRFEPLALGKTKTSQRDGEFGPEIGFALEMQMADKPQYLIKYYASGMPLHHGWNGNQWAGGPPQPNRRNFYPGQAADDPNIGTLYRQMLAKFQAGVEQLKRAGKKPVIRGFLWMQGEQDAKHADSANSYAANLRRLRDRLVDDMQAAPNLPLVFGQVLPYEPALPRFTHRSQLRAQMAAADRNSGKPESIPQATMVSTDGFGLLPDTVHYDAEGQMRLGKAMAQAMKRQPGPTVKD